MRIKIKGLDDQKFKKKLQLKKIGTGIINEYFFIYQKQRFNYPKAYIKDIQATREAFRTQRKTSSTSKHEIS
jgi:hypothetical protein